MAKPAVARLGDLEAAVMQHLWTQGASDVKAVHRAVGERRAITLNTVQSTMERLHKKGLLLRDKVSHAFVYAPVVSRERYGADLVRDVVESVLGKGAGPMLSAFVDVTARTGDDALAKLESLVAERRRASAPGKKKP